jgi:hypothetical protein
MSSERLGCLGFLASLFGLEPAASSWPYRVSEAFLTPTELSFYHVLRSAVGDRCVICPKPSLKDIFYITLSGQERMRYLNKIDRKHVDFLLCDPKTMKPLAGIELNDRSHDREDRRQRDMFVQELFQKAGLPLVTIRASTSYRVEEVAQRIWEALQPAQRATPAVSSKDTPQSTPTCPRCGVPMVLRRARRGSAGSEFYGCPNYPHCRETVPIS